MTELSSLCPKCRRSNVDSRLINAVGNNWAYLIVMECIGKRHPNYEEQLIRSGLPFVEAPTAGRAEMASMTVNTTVGELMRLLELYQPETPIVHVSQSGEHGTVYLTDGIVEDAVFRDVTDVEGYAEQGQHPIVLGLLANPYQPEALTGVISGDGDA